uniref:Uncharacterized protein n=1 Tax=Anguilla anguilla TaxID=7936 RepID=A0A0E9VTC3_ANGAN
MLLPQLCAIMSSLVSLIFWLPKRLCKV